MWFRSLGQDAVAVTEAGLSGANDSEIRSFAMHEERVLITLDADFGNILRYPVHATPGVIWLRLHPPDENAVLEALARVLRHLEGHSVAGKLVIVDEDKMRVRG